MFAGVLFNLGGFLFALGVLHPLIRLEVVSTIALVVLAAFTCRMRWIGAVERYWSRLARRGALTLAAIFLLPLVLRAVLLISYPPPAPFLHDEFGNILLADTFAHWRVANPTHSFWIHFETFHVVQHPLYFSFRPPVPGLFLALFKPLTGSMWGGVCIGMGLMCAAFLWMLRGWFPPRWALLGALLATMQIGVLSYWMNSYWGGQWAALGGALLLGGLGRLLRYPRAVDAVLMAIGGGLVINTRPFEGGVVALTAAAILLARFVQGATPNRRALWRAVFPGVIAGGLILVAMLYYNFRLTGNPLELPYQLGVQAYNWAPALAWQSPGPPKYYNHDVMRRCFQEWEIVDYRKWKATPLAETLLDRLAETWQFFMRPALSLALLAFPWVVFRDRRIRPLLWICLVMVPVTLVSVWYNPHYIAPAAAAFYGILIQGMRHLRVWSRRGSPYWAAMARVIPVSCALTLGVAMAMDLTGARVPPNFRGWCGRYQELRARAEISARVSSLAGGHLILVRYRPDHNYFAEWVYNDADIDRAKIVWAREMDPARNAALMNYFHGRKAWLLEADLNPPRLSPYPAP